MVTLRSTALVLLIELYCSYASSQALNRLLPGLRLPPAVPRPLAGIINNRPRPPSIPISIPSTYRDRLSSICLSCQDDAASSRSQERLDLEATMDRIYGSRASTYDMTFHRNMAKDYIKWMDPKPGQNIIDMACGTGLITIPAKQAVGVSGQVIGIDVSSGMLNQARRKAQAGKEDISFLQDDVTELRGTKFPIEFDTISCASAFIILKNPVPTLSQWTTYLKPGGRILLDIPTDSCGLLGHALALAADEFKVDLNWKTTRDELDDSLRRLFHSAGLRPIRTFASPVYNIVEYDLQLGLQRLQKALDGGRFPSWQANLTMRHRAEDIYVEEFAKRMRRDGMVREESYVLVGIGEKPFPGESAKGIATLGDG